MQATVRTQYSCHIATHSNNQCVLYHILYTICESSLKPGWAVHYPLFITHLTILLELLDALYYSVTNNTPYLRTKKEP